VHEESWPFAPGTYWSFIRSHDVRIFDDADARQGFLVVHPAPGGRVDLAEENLRFQLDGVVHMDADRNEAKPKEAFQYTRERGMERKTGVHSVLHIKMLGITADTT
jgi:hypothetical protein